MLDNDQSQKATSYIRKYLWLVLIFAVFVSGVALGRWQKTEREKNKVGPNIAEVVNISRSTNRADQVDFNQFWEIWDRAKRKHVKQPVKEVDLFYGALQGLVAGLNDPYSVYFPPVAAEEFSKSLAGEFSGIGAEIGVKNNQLMIISPLPGSPAEREGLRPADKILAIDKRLTIGIDVNTAVNKIRGPAGTTTTLTIGREGVAKQFDVTITRATINIPALLLAVRPDGVAHLRIMQFNDETTNKLSNIIRELQKKKATGVILDLRNNPGGLLESAVTLASEWVTDGVIVKEQLYNGEERVHETGGEHRLAGMPTVVLVNGGSASASEIVAGALRDHGAATIIGEKTFGKGSVQDLEEFSDGSALKLTIAEWFTPNGTNINETGIVPDVEVKEDFEKEKVGEDVMIDRAVEILMKKKNN